MVKINWKQISFLLMGTLLALLLLYSRLINLGWGLPYQMHPDERNMVSAITQLTCSPPEVVLNLPKSIGGEWNIFNWVKISAFDMEGCLNPRFFAYGQFPIYLGYAIVLIMKFFDGDLMGAVGFQEATLALRLVSAAASILTGLLLVAMSSLFFDNKHRKYRAMLLTGAIITFSPYAIQFAHFGTTESLLMFYYTAITYLAIKLLKRKTTELSFVFQSAILVGLAGATKVSSAVFATVPVLSILASDNSRLKYPLWFQFFRKILDISFFSLFSFVIFLFFSPHIIINFNDFIGSMSYESGVALGRFTVFYTKQFVDTIPVVFQFEKIFPHALGQVGFVLFLLGFIFLSWSNKKINFIRLAFLAYFLPNAFMFAKWSRFMSPVMPLMTLISVLFIMIFMDDSPKKNILSYLRSMLLAVIVIGMIIPGAAYLSIYQNRDVRVMASRWIYENVPDSSYLLSETANVVDIPLYSGTESKNYTVISFNFYELDNDITLQAELAEHLGRADYILVPSRRIFANHNETANPAISRYYQDLFSGKLGFEKVAEFTSYPKIEFSGKTLVELPDESAEETWTVFDHPVIRIYRRVKG